MIGILAATVLYALVSAFVPFAPIEPYLLGVVAATGANPVALGLAAAVGQTAGKILTFLGARGGLRFLKSRALKSRFFKDRFFKGRTVKSRGRHRAPSRLLEWLDRPALAVPIVLVSSLTGVPPLLVTCVYAARTPMPAALFGSACLIGLAGRFVAVALAPSLVT